MPSFIIIGAQRSGTTSLYEYLIKHPQVKEASTKEIHFFDYNYNNGISWYLSQFPKPTDDRIISGEASPYYIFHPLAAQRIFQSFPTVKIIVLLRNPVDRAYSHYQLQVRNGVEKMSFEDAIKMEPERLHGEEERIKAGNYYSFAHQKFSYLSRGIYVLQLKNWIKFFPLDQFCILKSEDFYNNPEKIFKETLEFLELPRFDLAEYKTYNTTNYPKINPATRAQLVEYFRPYNKSLYELLHRNFEWD